MGTVVKVEGPEVVTVRFDHGGERRLSLKYANLSSVTLEREARLLAQNEQDLVETFAAPDKPSSHGHGSHWEPFLDNANVLLKMLPEVLKRSLTIPCWADNARAGSTSFSLPPDEPRGTNVTPSPSFGMMLVIQQAEHSRKNELVSAYPWVSGGVEHYVQLKKVYPWHNGLEAQIEASLGEMSIALFDSLYARHKYFYKSGRNYSFMLSGIAYACEVVSPEPIVINNSETIRRMRQETERDPEDLSPIMFHTEGMAAFLPIPEGDRDDYRFQAPVKDIKETQLLGMSAWKIRATVARLGGGDSDTDLDIYVTEKALRGKVPESGDDIAGSLWLQGHMMRPMSFPL